MDAIGAPRSKALPLPVGRALTRLGTDIRDARRRRRIPTATMAERAGISRTTLHKVERGDPGVSLGARATVLFVLGLEERLAGSRSIEGVAGDGGGRLELSTFSGDMRIEVGPIR